MQAVADGLGGTAFEYDDQRGNLIAALERNIYAFSSAKSLAQQLHYRSLMVSPEGQLRPFTELRNLLIDQGQVFNISHLKVEVDLAHHSAIAAHKWDTLDSEYLEYSTVGDHRVRPTHAALDKFTALKTDPVWRRIYTPNGFGCRCTVIPGKGQNAEKGLTSIQANTMMKAELKDTIFDNNVGISRVIFKDNHPYFENAKGKTQQLSWQQYGLPSKEKIEMRTLPQFPVKTVKEYFDWWNKQPKHGADDILITDITGKKILLGSSEGKAGKPEDYFKRHVLQKEKETRYRYAAEVKNVLSKPDEIWSNENGRLYVKYYDQGAIVVAADQQLEAKTIYMADNNGSLERVRRGVLLYNK